MKSFIHLSNNIKIFSEANLSQILKVKIQFKYNLQKYKMILIQILKDKNKIVDMNQIKLIQNKH